MNLSGFIDQFKEAIAKRVVESYSPLYLPSENGPNLPRLLRTPMGARRTPSRARCCPSGPTGVPSWLAKWARARPSSAAPPPPTPPASGGFWSSARPT